MRQRYLKMLLLLIFTSGYLSSCAPVKYNSSKHRHNVHINTESGPKKYFSKVIFALDVYRLDSSCKKYYLGRVTLKDAQSSLGLPVNIKSYLVFQFFSKSYLKNSKGSTNSTAIIKVRPSHHYYITMTYKEDIYNVEIQQSKGENSKRRPYRSDGHCL